MMVKGESRKKDVGNILLGFAVLMFGMETMSSAVSELADNTYFTKMMTAFENPILGMVVGAILTAIIQSSSASVGMLQALCSTGAVHYSVALPIIMGQNIGTCVTSIISSVGANRNAKRAAMIHLYFNLIGTTIFMLVFYTLNSFIHFIFLNISANAAGIAVIHSLFNIGATMVLFPFSDMLVKLAEITIPDKEISEEAFHQVTIDERFLERPAFAMELCRTKARDMASLAQKAIEASLEVLISYDEKKADEVVQMEAMADQYEDVLGSFLVKLSGKSISNEDSQSMSIILHSISDFERISDHAMEIVVLAKKMNEKGLSFTQDGKAELETLGKAIKDISSLAVSAFCRDDQELAMHVEPLEEVIDTLSKRIKKNHVKRLKKGKCTIKAGIILEDILMGLERVSDHFSNVAVEMITIYDNEYNTHEYFKNFTSEKKEEFDKEYNELLLKYVL
jgi:phosphate:Na+ symporter